MKKVTAEQVNEVIKKHGSGPPTMRLGQHLMNELMPDVSCSEVYHETDNITALHEFVERFVES